jgi:hypothetical protein
MRASAIPIVMLLTFVPPPALSFSEDEFCFAVTDIARRMNARKGKWLDARLPGLHRSLVPCQ